MHTLLIQYLIEIIKYQRRLIILLALWLFQFISNSRMPQPDKPIYKRFNQFEVDEAVPLLAADIQPEKLDYQELLAQHLTDTGKPIKAVRRRKPIDFQALRCARCDAPSDYLYANNGKGGQLECKVCHFKFQRRDGDYKKDVSLRCPYCTHALYLHNKRVNFDVWVCPNDNCSYRQGKVAQLSPKQLAAFSAEPTRFKVRYTYRDFRFELKSVDADSPIQTTVDLGRIRATPQVLGLVLTYHINYGMSARKTAALMYDVHGIKISHQTIHNYEEAVAAVVRPFWANYPYKLSEELVGDETYIRVKGKWNYIFYFYDALNKLILADYVTPHRTSESAAIAINQVLQKFDVIPEKLRFIVDANPIYQVARIYFAKHGINFDIKQVIGLKNKDEVSTEFRYLKQIIERLNREYKGHYRSTTGFGSAKGSASYTTLFSACYNFLRPHEALNYHVPVPIDAVLAHERMFDKWLALIALAQEQLPVAA
ncbi:DDE-type integrase/transposase/recombinase [Schleiferilactobacillus harbinensis]|uniref:DDE-type integrase/transposase/recombinase n=1 Tax=Schleiferilactobacillus harbinensis TaxID=304207 RepID=UPI00123960AD|nr:DDE-type integrase/transposase/recombinase [Schleiferilactobacillus harbinensis]QEU47651.1 DDE-type integrase/transposase/recombinase [Schleiferilactobacillus harbinensis]QEU47942.1 DDE-type integrase/transposase/recombinase [Schleiferilactobacillus harbinensis]QEU48018.1 DDE-type integrase/transposase/recombinase [Schleiferilactobacillus harbinensis]QEU48027.1 DDE-type integrase/transposase/recombinase [Schleiferilactobacillus harbinensis]QEU48108.1 DDE-type integrase/transposase/recombina